MNDPRPRDLTREPLSALRELGETPTVPSRRPLDLDDPRWRTVCERVAYRYYIRELIATEEDGTEHHMVEVGRLGPIVWREQT